VLVVDRHGRHLQLACSVSQRTGAMEGNGPYHGQSNGVARFRIRACKTPSEVTLIGRPRISRVAHTRKPGRGGTPRPLLAH
jgi:hypothetical protein